MTKSAPVIVRLLAVGDIMLHGAISQRITQNRDPLYPFRPILPKLTGHNLFFGNLETPITLKKEPSPGTQGKYFSLPGTGKALKEAGFHVLNLAHNHIFDWGAEGVETTLNELKKAGLSFGGVGRTPDEAAGPAITEVPGNTGLKVGFLFYTLTYNTNTPNNTGYICCPPSDQFLNRHISKLKKEVPLVTVSIHGGMCMNSRPSPEMLERCRKAVELGADVVLGHHAHVPQGIEIYKGKLIAYGLPDFTRPLPLDTTEAFGTHIRDEYDSYILDATIPLEGTPAFHIIPCKITGQQQTRPSTPEEAEGLVNEIKGLSEEIRNGSSSRLHFSRLQESFGSYFGKGLLRQLKQGGFKWVWLRLRTIKPYHLRLLWSAIKARLT